MQQSPWGTSSSRARIAGEIKGIIWVGNSSTRSGNAGVGHEALVVAGDSGPVGEEGRRSRRDASWRR